MNERDQTAAVSPATGEELGAFLVNTPAEVAAAAKVGRTAQRGWAETPVKERAAVLLKVRAAIVERADDLAHVISRDNGKTRVDAMVTEILPAAMAAGYYAKNAASFLKDQKISPGSLLLANKRSRVVRRPFGVVGIISPWNYPFAIPFSEVVMALAAGNAVFLKTASQTQAVGNALADLFKEVGLPDGLFHHLNLPGKVAGEAFLAAPVDKLFFTGSVAVGKELMALAARTLTPVCLELGGNDPMLVTPKANLDRAAAGAVWAGLSNCGQSCGGVERIYVHQEVYKPFLDRLAARVKALRVGPDVDFGVDLGAMTTKKQMDAVEAHIKDATAQGAYVFARSADPPADAKGNFMAAVLLTEVNHGMRVMREETFGPVLAVMPVADMAEAVRLANDCDLGLTASVWSDDAKEADQLARQILAGVVTVNDHLMSHGLAETPWGGG